MMDGIGLALEQYDALGRYRTSYPSGRSIDPSGFLKGRGLDLQFKDAIDMQLKLSTVGSAQVNNCFAQNVLENAMRNEIDGSALSLVDKITSKTSGKGYKTLVKEVVHSSALWRE